MKRTYVLMALSLATLLATTSCAASVRQDSSESTSSSSSPSVEASKAVEPVTLIGTVRASDPSLSMIEDHHVTVFVNDLALGIDEGAGEYLSNSVDRSGGQVVFKANPGDEVRFRTQNFNLSGSISCELTNENGVTLASDSAQDALTSMKEDDTIDAAMCELTVP